MCTKTAALRRHDGAENQLSPDLLTMNNTIGYDNILAILCDTFFFWLPFFSFFAISTWVENSNKCLHYYTTGLLK